MPRDRRGASSTTGGINKTVQVTLTGATITNVDFGFENPAVLSVSSPAVTEGTDGFTVFTVSLGNTSTTPVSVSLALANGSATGGGTDYGTDGAGNLQVSTNGGATWADATGGTIAAGSTSVLVRTPVTDDILNEVTETFALNATVTADITTNPAAAGTGTIGDLDNSLGGFVYVDANNNGTFDLGETPVGGVTVTLTGFNDLAAPVTLTALTGGTGAYDFTNLRPGT